jgi:hypothetical protein
LSVDGKKKACLQKAAKAIPVKFPPTMGEESAKRQSHGCFN